MARSIIREFFAVVAIIGFGMGLLLVHAKRDWTQSGPVVETQTEQRIQLPRLSFESPCQYVPPWSQARLVFEVSDLVRLLKDRLEDKQWTHFRDWLWTAPVTSAPLDLNEYPGRHGPIEGVAAELVQQGKAAVVRQGRSEHAITAVSYSGSCSTVTDFAFEDGTVFWSY